MIVVQILLLVLAGYNALVALWGWRDRRMAPRGNRDRPLRVVVPAHNEATVVGGILDDLRASNYRNKEIWVLADRCEDSTASAARQLGAEVAERPSGPDGKGAALGWYLNDYPLDEGETLVVFDADNRVPHDILGRIADELDAGHRVLQCYLDVTNARGSLIAQASALSYWAANRMVQLARSNLGWSADLGGTGMAIAASALNDVGGFGSSLAEDQDLAVRLLLAGEQVVWLHDVRVMDQKPTSLAVAMRQRARWMAGRRSVRRANVLPLLRMKTMASFDQALRLVQPGRSFVALLSGIFMVASLAMDAAWLLPWPIWLAATAIQVVEPIPFLAKERVPMAALVRYPLLAILAALWIPIRIMSQRVVGWYHTPHESDMDDSDI